MAGGGVGEAMLISAAMGGGTAAVTGGDPLKGALLGAATGGIGHGIAGATAAGGANVGTQVATTGAEQMVAQTAADQAAQTAAMQGVTPDAIAGVTPPVQNLTAQAASPDMIAGVSDLQATQNLAAYTPNPTEMTKLAQAAENPMFPKIAEMSKSGYFYPGLGAASGLIGAGPETNMPSEDEYSGSLGRFNYDPDRYRPYRAASGGLMDTEPARRMAAGGLGSYSDGGQMLKGPGDGMSDDIPASIGDEQPARLADGEFVVPADVVSGIGNGSTDAGAEALYAMLDRVRKARTGRTEQAPEIDAQRMMPA
jgi:hypothetical protein